MRILTPMTMPIPVTDKPMTCRYFGFRLAAGAPNVETLLSLTKSRGLEANTVANSHTPPVVVDTPLVLLAVRCVTSAIADAWDRYIVPVPSEGIEIGSNGGACDGLMQFGVTANSAYALNPPFIDALITGYEY